MTLTKSQLSRINTLACNRWTKFSIWLGIKLNITGLKALGYQPVNEACHFVDQTSEMLNRHSLVIDFNKHFLVSIGVKLIRLGLNLKAIFKARGTANG